MNTALWAAMTGLEAQQTKISVISNNLANASTNGFKSGRAMFEDLVYQNVRQAGAQSSEQTQLPSGLMLGTGVRVVATAKTFTQGAVSQTDRALDVAVRGRGFFQVLQPDGSISYTRDGAFQVNADGELVTSSGNLVQPGISIPSDAQSVTIGDDGIVSATLAGQPDPIQVGTLQLADFINPAGLQARGQNMFLETAASGPAQAGTPGLNGLGTLQQNALEGSNVNVVAELVSMIETQRAYELNSRAVATSDEMLQYLTNNV
ncbi:MAG: flagellar basal-body rod protein FlgG [Gammaproteobacteria bacterium]|nr:flagellar basal-body rod protein FlgG [Gammaproteobacteria bacterium]